MAARRWLRLAPRYLGRLAQGIRVLRRTLSCKGDSGRHARCSLSGKIGVSVQMEIAVGDQRTITALNRPERSRARAEFTAHRTRSRSCPEFCSRQPVFAETGRISSSSRSLFQRSKLRVRSLPLRRSILVATTAKSRPAARSHSMSWRSLACGGTFESTRQTQSFSVERMAR